MEKNFIKIIDREEIAKCVSRLQCEISQYVKKNHIEILNILWVADGAMFFAADLARGLDFGLRMESVKVSSYGDAFKSNGNPQFSADFSKYKNCDVLIVDDILETGNTMSAMIDAILSAGAKSVKSCAMLNKKIPNKKIQNTDFCGVEIEDKFVFGYGLDFRGMYRNLPEIWVYIGE